MKWVSCTQPILFPPLHLIERFVRCDEIVLMVEAQLARDSNHAWNVVQTKSGPLRFGPDLVRKGRRPIADHVLRDPAAFSEKLYAQMKHAFGKRPGFQELEFDFCQLCEDLATFGEGLDLAELNRITMAWCLHAAGGQHVRISRSVSLLPERPKDPCEWMAQLAQAAGATDYLQGARSIETYFRPGSFKPKGVRVWGQRYEAPLLEQLGPSLYPVSVLDPLFMHGTEAVRRKVFAHRGRGTDADTLIEMPGFA